MADSLVQGTLARAHRDDSAAAGRKGSGLLRGLAILEAVCTSTPPPTHGELIARLGLPKATVYRLCRQLIDEDMLQPDPSGTRLLPGHRMMRAVRGALAVSGDANLRHAVLQALSAEIGETCNLVIPAGSEMLYIDRVEVDSPLGIRLAIGSRNPMHCVPSGKLYLSSLDARQRRRMIRHLPLERFTTNTITDPGRLEDEMKRVRGAGFATDIEEFVTGMIGIGVRIPLADPRSFVAIGVHAPISRLTPDRIPEYLPAMRRTAVDVAETFEEH